MRKLTMKHKYKDEIDENGYPLDKGYLEIGLPGILKNMTIEQKIKIEQKLKQKPDVLEVGLPEMLQESIDKMKIVNQLLAEGIQYLGWDCEWCELSSDINIYEAEGIISSEQAWYLREKYLGMRKEDNIG